MHVVGVVAALRLKAPRLTALCLAALCVETAVSEVLETPDCPTLFRSGEYELAGSADNTSSGFYITAETVAAAAANSSLPRTGEV